MPIHSIETMNQMLDAWLGPDRAAGCPDEYQVEGWFDDPSDAGADEADFDGYEPYVLSSNNWGPAEGGETETTGLVSLGTPTVDDADRIRYWALRNTTSGVLAFSAALDDPVDVIEDVEIQIQPVVRYARR